MRRYNLSRTAPVLAAAAMLAACTGQSGITPVTNVYYDYSFAGTEAGFMSGYNPIPVYIRGAPSGSERAIVDTMNQNRAAGMGRLVFAPTATPRPEAYQVVLVFGEAGANYCQLRADTPPAPPAGGALLSGALCTGSRLRSSGAVNLASADLPGAVDSLTTALFSPDLDISRRRPFGGGQNN